MNSPKILNLPKIAKSLQIINLPSVFKSLVSPYLKMAEKNPEEASEEKKEDTHVASTSKEQEGKLWTVCTRQIHGRAKTVRDRNASYVKQNKRLANSLNKTAQKGASYMKRGA